jgi:hypothetical protein
MRQASEHLGSRHTAAQDRSLRTVRRKTNRYRNELDRVEEVAGIISGCPVRNSQDLWIGVSRDLLITS